MMGDQGLVKSALFPSTEAALVYLRSASEVEPL